jgi:uncharacterized protein
MLVMAFVMGSAASAAESVSEIKVPELTSQAVFLTKEPISKTDQDKIINALQGLENHAKVPMAVLVVDSVQPFSIEDYSIKVAEKWKIGKEKEDNGVILIVATQDKKARIEVGYGMEGKITDAISSRIINDYIIPEFKQKNWTGGILQAIGKIENIAYGKPLDSGVNPVSSTNSNTSSRHSSSSSLFKSSKHIDSGDAAIIILIIAVIVAVIALFTTAIGKMILIGMVIGTIVYAVAKGAGSIITGIVGAVVSGIAAFCFIDGYWFIAVISGGLFGSFGILWIFDILEILLNVASSIRGSSSSSSSGGGYSGGGGRFGGGGSSGSW